MTSDRDPDVGDETELAESGGETAEENERWPIGFMLTILMVSLYVGYRLVQLTVKFFEWLL